MTNSMAEGGAVALYWDFENLHAALFESKHGDGSYGKDCRFKPQDALIDIQSILELASSLGPIAVNRAYGNWQFFGRYRDALLQGAVELIQLFPPGASAKNGADIKLCLDATEDVSRFRHIATVIIVGGDSDFMPVAQKIKAAGRTLFGIGARRATNKHWAKSCHEFWYYENLRTDARPSMVVSGSETGIASAPANPVEAATSVLVRAIRGLCETRGEAWIEKARIRPVVKRLDPTFDPKEFGFADFSAFLKSLDGKVVAIRKGKFDQQVSLCCPGPENMELMDDAAA